MQAHQPALVYAPQPAPGVAPQIDAFLHAHRFYRFHDLVEAPEDVSLPVTSRPVLRLALVLADLADREGESREVQSGADEKEAPLFPRVFVTDRLESLGDDPVSQAAVVGALLDQRVAVYVGTPRQEGLIDFIPLDDSAWWSMQRKLLGDDEVRELMDELTDSKAAVEMHGARWMAMDPEGLGILGTRFQRTWIDAQRRRASLIEGGESPTVAAKILAVEGYQNKSGRVLWYPSMAKGDQ